MRLYENEATVTTTSQNGIGTGNGMSLELNMLSDAEASTIGAADLNGNAPITQCMPHASNTPSAPMRTVHYETAQSKRKACSTTRRSAIASFGIGLATLLAAALTAPHDASAAELGDIKDSYDDLTSQLDALATEYQELSRQREQTQAQIDELSASIASQQETIASINARIADREAQRYKGSTPLEQFAVMLDSSDFDELVRNSYYVDRANRQDEELRREHDDAVAELGRQQAELSETTATLDAQMSEIEAKQSEVNDALAGLSDDLRARLSQDDPELLAAAEASGDVLSVLTTSVGSADAVVAAAYSTGSTGVGFCAAWVANVMAAGGVGRFNGNACDYYWWYCDSADVDAIAPGMIIAVPSEPYSYAAQIYGHIGVYVGNGTVRHCVSGVVKDQSLQSWIDEFGVTTQPRWGWMGDVMLV